MSNRRVIINDWLVRERSLGLSYGGDSAGASEIDHRVQEALAGLDEDEREFIVQFYFMGRQERQIAEATGRRVGSVQSLHKRAMRKLRRALRRFVRERFGIEAVGPFGRCPLCESEFSEEIDRLILARDRTATWRPVMRVIAERYGIMVSSPQVLIGHERYHIGRRKGDGTE